MAGDLPIYSETTLRTSLQFADLERLKGSDASGAWLQADQRIAAMEGAADVTVARESLNQASKAGLLRAHTLLFPRRTDAGQWRRGGLAPLYRGQDCAPPEFIDRSVDNLITWVNAESFSQIHPIEQSALAMTRIIDLWPFAFGNLTVALVFGNVPLQKAALGPFSVLPEHRTEFEKAIAQCMTIDMQPLINAIYRTVKKEMEALGKR